VKDLPLSDVSSLERNVFVLGVHDFASFDDE